MPTCSPLFWLGQPIASQGDFHSGQAGLPKRAPETFSGTYSTPQALPRKHVQQHILSYIKVFVLLFPEGRQVTSYTKEYNNKQLWLQHRHFYIHSCSVLVITIRSSNRQLRELFVLMNSIRPVCAPVSPSVKIRQCVQKSTDTTARKHWLTPISVCRKSSPSMVVNMKHERTYYLSRSAVRGSHYTQSCFLLFLCHFKIGNEKKTHSYTIIGDFIVLCWKQVLQPAQTKPGTCLEIPSKSVISVQHTTFFPPPRACSQCLEAARLCNSLVHPRESREAHLPGG